MSKIETVRALLIKAGREDTPIDEARATALQAARLIAKYGFYLVEKKPEDVEPPHYESGWGQADDEYEIPDFDPSDFVPIEPFHHEVAKYSMVCFKCKKEIRKGTTFARQVNSKTPKVTHFECRSYFTETK